MLVDDGSNLRVAMSTLDSILWALATGLTAASGVFLLRDSVGGLGAAFRHGRWKVLTLGGLLVIGSFFALGMLSLALAARHGAWVGWLAPIGYFMALWVGWCLVHKRVVWQWLVNATVAAWVAWFGVQDRQFSWADGFMLGGMLAWIVAARWSARRARVGRRNPG